MDYVDTFNSMFDMDFVVAQNLVAMSVATVSGEPQAVANEAFEHFLYA